MRRIPTTIAILVLLALLASGCSAATGQPAPTVASPVPTRTPGATTTLPAATAVPTLPPASPDAWLLVGRTGADGLEVILASTTEKLFDLPAGLPARPDWGRMVVATPLGGRTIVRDLVVQPGFGGPQIEVDGDWRLPTIGHDAIPAGLSADGSTLVLVEARAASASAEAPTKARFAVLRVTPLERPHRIVELPGDFEYDAISPDGATLYVVEHLAAKPGGRYQVRAVDVASGTLRNDVVADKRNISEPMAGWPLAQLRRPDGGVFTLYRGAEHPFIHALDTAQGTAVCIDLPATGGGDPEAARDWGLAPTPDGTAIFAVNATLGLALEVDPAQLGIRRSVSVEPLAAGGIALAKFGHLESGPVGRRVVVGPDGLALYAAGAGGILAIATADLTVTGRFLEGQGVAALGLTADGGTLYALLHDAGRIVRLDAATGKVLGQVPGDGYDRLLAVVAW